MPIPTEDTQTVAITPWTEDIDADGFDLNDFSNLEFRNTTGAPAGTTPAIWATAAGIITNVPSGNTFSVTINGTEELSISSSYLDTKANSIKLGLGAVEFRDVGTTILESGNSDLLYDVSTGNTHEFRFNDVSEYIFSETQIDLNAHNLFDMGNILFTNTGGAPGATVPAIYSNNTGDINLNVPSTKQFSVYINGAQNYIFNSVNLHLLNKKIVGVSQLSWNTSGNQMTDQGSGAGKGIEYDVTTLSGHRLLINSTLEYLFDKDNFTITDANNIVLGTTTGTKIGTATTQKIGFWNATPVVQPTHIADPAGGATVDSEARTAINSILAQLATLGLQAAA